MCSNSIGNLHRYNGSLRYSQRQEMCVQFVSYNESVWLYLQRIMVIILGLRLSALLLSDKLIVSTCSLLCSIVNETLQNWGSASSYKPESSSTETEALTWTRNGLRNSTLFFSFFWSLWSREFFFAANTAKALKHRRRIASVACKRKISGPFLVKEALSLWQRKTAPI